MVIVSNVVSVNQSIFHFVTFNSPLFPSFHPREFQVIISKDYISPKGKIARSVAQDSGRSVIDNVIFFNQVVE